MTLIIDHKSVPDAAGDANALPSAPPEAATDNEPVANGALPNGAPMPVVAPMLSPAQPMATAARSGNAMIQINQLTKV